MAHFAELGVNDIVIKTVYLDNIKNMTLGGIEKESIGAEYLRENHGGTWVQFSLYTHEGVHVDGRTPFRANTPSADGTWKYNSEYDIFHQINPPTDRLGVASTSWVLNTTTGAWESPYGDTAVQKPFSDGHGVWEWDEQAYQSDTSDPKTAGWVWKVGIGTAPL